MSVFKAGTTVPCPLLYYNTSTDGFVMVVRCQLKLVPKSTFESFEYVVGASYGELWR